MEFMEFADVLNVNALQRSIQVNPVRVNLRATLIDACQAVHMDLTLFDSLGVIYTLDLKTNYCLVRFSISNFYSMAHMMILAGKEGKTFKTITERNRVDFIYHHAENNMITIISRRKPEQKIGSFVYWSPFNCLKAMIAIVKQALKIKANNGLEVEGAIQVPSRNEDNVVPLENDIVPQEDNLVALENSFAAISIVVDP